MCTTERENPTEYEAKTEEKAMISTRNERAINIMEAQNRNLQIFAEALKSGSIDEEKYKELVQVALEQARAELAELG